MTLEDRARQRVEADPDLAKYAPILLADWHPGHYDWVAFAGRDDLLQWAKTLPVAQGLPDDRLLNYPVEVRRAVRL
jgi:hypothetical protein